MDGGTNLPEALTAGLCLSRLDHGAISIGSFQDDFAAKNAGVLFTQQGGAYAIGADRRGEVWLFVASHPEANEELSPLLQFGFTIQPSG